jgi:hypothetical protein
VQCTVCIDLTLIRPLASSVPLFSFEGNGFFSCFCLLQFQPIGFLPQLYQVCEAWLKGKRREAHFSCLSWASLVIK